MMYAQSLYNIYQFSPGGEGRGGGGHDLAKFRILIDNPPIYDITSGCRVAALFSREAQSYLVSSLFLPIG